MDTLFDHCAGLDVHKRNVVACRITHDSQGKRVSETRTFDTDTPALLEMPDWLAADGCTHIAMESTGVYWQPIYNILEGNFEVWAVNAHHLKNVPGRKTDPKDAAWIAKCLEHGLVNPSFVPAIDQRDLRELTRARLIFVRERTNIVNRIQKVLEEANIKLASVASDVMGKSGRAMMDALVHGETDAASMAELAKGRLRDKREHLERALTGRMRQVHQTVLSEMLVQVDNIDESISRLNSAIEDACHPFDEAMSLLVTMPGISTNLAQTIIGEIGTDMSRFPTAGHLCAWGGVAPGNNQSGGRRLPSKKRHGNTNLCTAMVQAAHAATKTSTYLAALFRRLLVRRGKKRAIVAVAHAMLQAIYYLLSRHQTYQDLGADYYDSRQPERMAKALMSRLHKLGYDVTVTSAPVAIAV